MGNKQGELEILAQENKYDIIGITETWWDNTHDWNTELEGYNLFKKNRLNKRGGGVALYVRKIYTTTEINLSDNGSPVETVWVKIQGESNTKDTVVGKNTYWELDGGTVPPEWHCWLHSRTDNPLTTHPPVTCKSFWEHHEFNQSGVAGQYVPYSSTHKVIHE
uniref:NADH dehydrogenase [ubiquinone] 1 alpha subcomplex subunit 12 n=1 Tax=Salvator merianae TaxID=96440 RepID=A0A8D0BMQ2_SALMN